MKRGLILIIAFCLFFVYYGYSQFPKYLYGIVSWYGDDFAGRKTASGEMYNPDDLTAAHRTLPFGTILDIENLENGRKIRIRINDRGPFVESRILDISKKAAESLDILKKGTVYAKITLIKIGDNKVVENSNQTDTNIIKPETANAGSNTNTPNQQTSTSAGIPDVNPQINQKAAVTPITVVTPPSVITPSASVSLNKTDSSTEPKKIIITNVMEVYVTNSVVLTNMIPISVTNIETIPPYEEKILEKDLSDSNKTAFNAGKIKDEEDFILDEPLDLTSLNALPPADNKFSSNIPAPSAPSNNIKSTNKDLFNESEVTPDSLLSNEIEINIDEKGLKGETFINTNLNKNPEKKEVKYAIQAGAFTSEESALKLYDLLKKNGYTVFTTESSVKGKRWIKVRIGYFDSPVKAREALEKLKKIKIKGLVVESK